MWTVRSALVVQPVFSPQIAVGRTTSARRAVSVSHASDTTVSSSSRSRIRWIREASGSETAGFVPMIQSSRIAPASAYLKIDIASVGGVHVGSVEGSTFQTFAVSAT
jgi:hypothetical protein